MRNRQITEGERENEKCVSGAKLESWVNAMKTKS